MRQALATFATTPPHARQVDPGIAPDAKRLGKVAAGRQGRVVNDPLADLPCGGIGMFSLVFVAILFQSIMPCPLFSDLKRVVKRSWLWRVVLNEPDWGNSRFIGQRHSPFIPDAICSHLVTPG